MVVHQMKRTIPAFINFNNTLGLGINNKHH